jgi:mannosyltransferase OCH1-like enzyme
MKIFQIWWNNNEEIPKVYKDIIEKNEWFFEKYDDYKLYKPFDIEFFLKSFNYNIDKFKSFEFRLQSDLIRFLILYEYGGIYLDLDVELYKNFEEFLDLLRSKYLEYDLIPSSKHIFFLKFRKHSPNLKRIINLYFSLNKLSMDSKIIKFSWLAIFKDFLFINDNTIYKYLKHHSVTR